MLRAITIAQPFASLMASGRLNQLVVPFKVPRKIIGQNLAIHAAKDAVTTARDSRVNAFTFDAMDAKCKCDSGRCEKEADPDPSLWGERWNWKRLCSLLCEECHPRGVLLGMAKVGIVGTIGRMPHRVRMVEVVPGYPFSRQVLMVEPMFYNMLPEHRHYQEGLTLLSFTAGTRLLDPIKLRGRYGLWRLPEFTEARFYMSDQVTRR